MKRDIAFRSLLWATITSLVAYLVSILGVNGGPWLQSIAGPASEMGLVLGLLLLLSSTAILASDPVMALWGFFVALISLAVGFATPTFGA